MAYEEKHLTELIGSILLNTNAKVLKKKQKIRLKMNNGDLKISYRRKFNKCKDTVTLGDVLYTKLNFNSTCYISKIKINLKKEKFEFNFTIKGSNEKLEGYIRFSALNYISVEFDY